MTQQEIIAKHLETLAKLNPKGISHLETAIENAESLEHVQALVENAVALAAAGKKLTSVNITSVPSKYADIHNLSFLVKATRKLVTGDTEIVDSNGDRCSLPAPFWCLSGYDGGADYRLTLAPYTPSGVQIYSVLPSADGKNLVITYKANNIVETVTIAMGGNKSYLSLLIGSRSSYTTLTKPKVKIDDVSQEAFFDESIFVLDQSLSGKAEEDYVIPNAFEPAENPNQTMREMAHEFAIDNEKGFVFMMVPNLKSGEVNQVNGQFWTVSLMCYSDGWHKVGGHPGIKK